MTHRICHLSEARGQALTEFLVIATVLIPLFLLMPLITKYQDIAYAAQMASRYVGFEALDRNNGMSSWKPEAQLGQEVRRRFFSNADAAIKTGDSAGNFKAHQNLFWRTPEDQSLIQDVERDVTVSFGPEHQPDHAHAATAAHDGVPFNLAHTAEALSLQVSGVYRANVHVKLFNLPASLTSYQPFNTINLVLSRDTSTLIDSWIASGAAQVEARIDHPALVPGTVLAAATPLINASVTLVEANQVAGPKLGELQFWRDVVPQDRLK